MMLNIITFYFEGEVILNCRAKNDDYNQGREGESQRVMIEIIISENDGRPLTPLADNYMTYIDKYLKELYFLFFQVILLTVMNYDTKAYHVTDLIRSRYKVRYPMNLQLFGCHPTASYCPSCYIYSIS